LERTNSMLDASVLVETEKESDFKSFLPQQQECEPSAPSVVRAVAEQAAVEAAETPAGEASEREAIEREAAQSEAAQEAIETEAAQREAAQREDAEKEIGERLAEEEKAKAKLEDEHKKQASKEKAKKAAEEKEKLKKREEDREVRRLTKEKAQKERDAEARRISSKEKAAEGQRLRDASEKAIKEEKEKHELQKLADEEAALNQPTFKRQLTSDSSQGERKGSHSQTDAQRLRQSNARKIGFQAADPENLGDEEYLAAEAAMKDEDRKLERLEAQLKAKNLSPEEEAALKIRKQEKLEAAMIARKAYATAAESEKRRKMMAHPRVRGSSNLSRKSSLNKQEKAVT